MNKTQHIDETLYINTYSHQLPMILYSVISECIIKPYLNLCDLKTVFYNYDNLYKIYTHT